MIRDLLFFLPFSLLILGCDAGNTSLTDEEKGVEESPKGVFNCELDNFVVRMIVRDNEGNNLLDPDVEGSFADSDALFAVFRDTSFYLNANLNDINDDFGHPEHYFLGLISEKINNSSPYVLSFGGLDPYQSIDYEDIVMNWPNGSRDIVTIYYVYDYHKNSTASIIYLNGSEVENGFTIIIE